MALLLRPHHTCMPQGTCRVCFEDCTDDDGVHPCECKANGEFTLAHRACVQRWIDLRPNLPTTDAGRRDPGVCEVCGCAWKQEYSIPAPVAQEAMPTRAALDERAMMLLLSAYARTRNLGGLRPHPNDALILRELGPLYDGPWRARPSSFASRGCLVS